MKKQRRTKRAPKMLSQYDFSRGVRGKHTERLAHGTNLVLLSPDVAEFFHDSKSVNAALRALIDIARKKKAKKAAS